MVTDSINQPQFIQAIVDYYYLVNRNYPKKESIKIIGDRYRLSGTLRTLLFRGVADFQSNQFRRTRLVNEIQNQELLIDGYNVLFTLLNYRMGRLVFIGTDNFCRDTGSLFGRIKKQEPFKEALALLVKFIKTLQPEYLTLFFDSPVSFSAEHKLLAESILESLQLNGHAEVVKSADKAIKNNQLGVICSSDSIIIDQTTNPVADLSLMTLKHYYNPDLLNLRLLLEGSGISC